MTHDESAQIEELLLTWYHWQERESFREVRSMWYPSQDQTCKQYRSGSLWAAENDQHEIDEVKLEDLTSEAIQLCIDDLAVEHRAAIQISMKNKTGPAVWRSNRVEDQHRTYQEAKSLLLPALRTRGFIKAELAA